MNISNEGQQHIEHIIKKLSASGFNLVGKSILLTEKPKPNQKIVLNFMRMYDISMDFFILCENILRFTNVYNALSATLNLKDKTLEKEIFKRLRDPGFFIEQYGLDHKHSGEKLKALNNIIEEGFASFIDNLSLPKQSILNLSPEILAEKFMIFASEGECRNRYDDTNALKVFSTAIADDLETHSKNIVKEKESLGWPD